MTKLYFIVAFLFAFTIIFTCLAQEEMTLPIDDESDLLITQDGEEITLSDLLNATFALTENIAFYAPGGDLAFSVVNIHSVDMRIDIWDPALIAGIMLDGSDILAARSSLPVIGLAAVMGLLLGWLIWGTP